MYSNISRVTNNDNQLIMVFTVQRVEAGATLRFRFPISDSKHSWINMKCKHTSKTLGLCGNIYEEA